MIITKKMFIKNFICLFFVFNLFCDAKKEIQNESSNSSSQIDSEKEKKLNLEKLGLTIYEETLNEKIYFYEGELSISHLRASNEIQSYQMINQVLINYTGKVHKEFKETKLSKEKACFNPKLKHSDYEAWTTDCINSFNSIMELKLLDSKYLSLKISDIIYSGGAHPNTDESGIVFDFKRRKFFNLQSIINSKKCFRKIIQKFKLLQKEYHITSKIRLEKKDVFSFYLKKGIIIFQLGEIFSHADGLIEIPIDMKFCLK